MRVGPPQLPIRCIASNSPTGKGAGFSVYPSTCLAKSCRFPLWLLPLRPWDVEPMVIPPPAARLPLTIGPSLFSGQLMFESVCSTNRLPWRCRPIQSNPSKKNVGAAPTHRWLAHTTVLEDSRLYFHQGKTACNASSPVESGI